MKDSKTFHRSLFDLLLKLFQLKTSPIFVLGYAIGSFFGGLLYKYIGGTNAMQVFSAFGVLCSVSHLVLHKTLLQHHDVPTANGQSEYKSPEEAIKSVNSIDIS